MSTSKKSFGSKGKAGQHKRYFKGKYLSKEIKASFELSVGEHVIFRQESKVLLGLVTQRVHDDEYEVSSFQNESCTQKHVITKPSNPKSTESGVRSIPKKMLQPLLDVLTIWDFWGEFVTLVTGKLIQVQENCLLVKPPQEICTHPVQVNLTDICLNPYQDLKFPIEEWNDQVCVCFVSSVLKVTQNEVDKLETSYRKALDEVCNSMDKNAYLSEKFCKLQAAYERTSHTVFNLRHTIINVQTESAKRVQTLG